MTGNVRDARERLGLRRAAATLDLRLAAPEAGSLSVRSAPDYKQGSLIVMSSKKIPWFLALLMPSLESK